MTTSEYPPVSPPTSPHGSESDLLAIFEDRDGAAPESSGSDAAWRVLVVDDDPEVHAATRFALGRSVIVGRNLDLASAYSAAEARALLEQYPDVAVILLDVVMEEHDAGLKFVEWMRAGGHEKPRIILRTGQPGYAPELRVIRDYDINDYRAKNELNRTRLISALTTAIRTYQQLCVIEAQRIDIETLAQAAVEYEAAARAAAESKSEFLSNMSHEIRTPMNGVLGILHLIKGGPPEPERERLVEQALACGLSLSDLLNSIIELADVETGRATFKVDSVDPAIALRRVADLYPQEILAPGVSLHVHCAPDLGEMLIDRSRLKLFFFNLIGNAVKFTLAGRIDVRLSAVGEGDDRRLRFEVQDTGVGIPAAKQAEIFECFRQGDGSSTRRFGGVGLGLSITQRLVGLMGGEIDFISEEGKGSTFWVELPVGVGATAALEPQRRDDVRPLQGLRILVVEDNAMNRLVLERILEPLGALVETAENGAEGVAAVQRKAFDLILMDIQMPVMDGVAATRRIRSLASPMARVPILATTANVLPDQQESYRACGMEGVVPKPITPGALLAEIARIAAAPDAETAPSDMAARA